MADIDFHPSKAEQQNLGKTTENTLSNAQNEINSNRGTVPNSSKAEIASQTEAMTKGDKPILPAFDLSDENQSKQSSTTATSDAKNSNSRKDSSADGKTGPTSPETNNNQSGSMDGKNEPTNSNPNASSQGASDGKATEGSDRRTSAPPTSTGSASDAQAVDGSDRVNFAPPTSAGNASAASSQTTGRP